ncbi:Putative pyruvate, phosphate dikinase regulatory protein [Frankliniella fusca]|uniref:Pyruvate, phosphate dikinase regulatory protein n=1 Tax=Frankliniella fusca TaxID=407009 RepID=A0AAE1HVK8_9NEOP|nr:Putative pyruvate, phosphate dikinase regulatory protein [Frankliniella fusca]
MSENPASISTKPDKVNFKAGNIEVEWTKFKHKFELYLIGAKQEKETSQVKFAQMLCLAGEDALEVYNSFKEKLITKTTNDQGMIIVTDDKSQDFDAVTAEFEKYAKEQKSLTACREYFNKRNQKAGEPLANWLTDLKNRIQHCEYQQIEDSIRHDGGC